MIAAFNPSQQEVEVQLDKMLAEEPVLFSQSSGYLRHQQTPELACKVYRHAGVHGALLVKKALRTRQAEHTFVPDVGVDVQTLAAVETETDKALGGNVVTGQRQRHHAGRVGDQEE